MNTIEKWKKVHDAVVAIRQDLELINGKLDASEIERSQALEQQREDAKAFGQIPPDSND